jgi:hypothetical protein
MSLSSEVALRKAMVAHLSADAALVGSLGGAKVFDEAPRGVEPPYVLIAETRARDWSTTGSSGSEQFVTLSAISTQRGVREALDIAQRLAALLDEAELTLEDHSLVDLRHQSSETKREANGRFARVDLRFRVTTERL